MKKKLLFSSVMIEPKGRGYALSTRMLFKDDDRWRTLQCATPEDVATEVRTWLETWLDREKK